MKVYYRLTNNDLSETVKRMVGGSVLYFVNGIYFYNTYLGAVVRQTDIYNMELENKIVVEYGSLL